MSDDTVSKGGRSAPRRRRRAVFVATLAGVAAIAVATTRTTEPRGTEGARRILDSPGLFSNGPRAGDSFARIASLLVDEGRACDRANPRAPGVEPTAEGLRCDGVLSAAAFAQVMAVAAIECTQPAVRRAVVDLSAYLDDIEAIGSARSTAPLVPEVPNCN